MKINILICCFMLFFLSSCTTQTEMDTATPGTEVTVKLSQYADEASRAAGLSEQELLGILLASGAEAIPDYFAVIQCQEQAGDMTVTAISVQTGEKGQYKVYLRIEQNKSAKIYPIEVPLSFEAIGLAVSRLDDSPVIGIAGKTGDTLSLYFYAITDDSLEDYIPLNWNVPEDCVMVEENRIIITGARGLEAYPGKAPVLFQIESDTEYCYAVIHDYQRYTSDTNNEKYTLRFVPGSWVLRMTEEQYLMLYETYDAYPSFDAGISLILEQNTEILAQKPWRLPLPEGYDCLDMCKGDLNGDGLEDIVVVIEQRPGMCSGSRMVYIMLAREDGGFELCWQSSSHLLGRGEGGIFGDPYSGISIHNGELSLYHYGGSSDRWGFSYTYAIQKGELVLTNFSELSLSTHTACGIRTTYDILNGIIEERSETYKGDLFDGLLLSTHTMEQGKIILFSDESYGQWNYPVQNFDSANPPLPSLYRVQYGEPAWEEPLLHASQALDIVMNSLYPFSTKHNYPYPEEIMDNYKTLLCYDIPSYYYTDGNATLTYSEQLVWNGVLYHYIRVQAPDGVWEKDIRVRDLTGIIDVYPFD